MRKAHFDFFFLYVVFWTESIPINIFAIPQPSYFIASIEETSRNISSALKEFSKIIRLVTGSFWTNPARSSKFFKIIPFVLGSYWNFLISLLIYSFLFTKVHSVGWTNIYIESIITLICIKWIRIVSLFLISKHIGLHWIVSLS